MVVKGGCATAQRAARPGHEFKRFLVVVDEVQEADFAFCETFG